MNGTRRARKLLRTLISSAALLCFSAHGQDQPEQHQHETEQHQPETGQHQHEAAGAKKAGPQKENKQHGHTMPGHDMPGHTMPAGASAPLNAAATFLMEQASGTSTNPASSPMHMANLRAGSWNLMAHVQASINLTQQSGPRGGDKFFSTNWFMGMAEHRAGRGSILFRAMLSLEPATVTQRRFPLLFQTGESAFGRPLADAQHPHDLFMELGVQYARPLGGRTLFHLYFAPVGDPALGPVAFPHRVSAMELPQATLGHHLQDSTHIANDVVTAGIRHGMLGIEVSGFHGAEPNELRWNIDRGAIDSWATRLTLAPTGNLSGQVSVGRLAHPEALEEGDTVRSTASLTYNLPLETGHWASSLIWGRNHKTAEKRNINSYALESLLQHRRNYVTGRIELVDKDELFSDQPEVRERLQHNAGSVSRVAAYTLGYTRDIKLVPGLQTGLGGNFTVYAIPRALKAFYGDRPAGFMVYLRFRLAGKGHRQHGSAP